MSYSDARSKAVELLGNIRKVLEYKTAWAFFGTQEFDNTVVISKNSGKTMTYSEFIMTENPKEKPSAVA